MNNLLICLNLRIPFIVNVCIPGGKHGSLAITTNTLILPVVLMALNAILFIRKVETSFLRCCLSNKGHPIQGHPTAKSLLVNKTTPLAT